MSSLQKADSYRLAANEATENAMNYRMTMDQKLAEYIANQPHPDGSGMIGIARLGDITSNPELMKRYVDSFAQKNIQDFMPSNNHSKVPDSQNAVGQAFNDNNPKIDAVSDIQDRYEHDKRMIANNAADQGMSLASIDRSTKQAVDVDIAKHRRSVDDSHGQTEQQGQQHEQKYAQEKSKSRSNNLIEDVMKGINTNTSGAR